MTAKKKKKKKNEGGLRKLVRFLRSERFRIVLGMVVMLAGIYMLLSFISYFFHWQADQDFKWEKVFSGPEIRVNNQGGKLGAWLSYIFVDRWFGISSLILPIVFFDWSLRLFRIRILRTSNLTRDLIIHMILLSVALGLIFGSASGLFGSGPGGGNGFYISRWLRASLGTVGSAFLVIILYTAFLVFTTPLIKLIYSWKEGARKSIKDDLESSDDIVEHGDESSDIEAEDHVPSPESDHFHVKDINNEVANRPSEPQDISENDDIEMTVEKTEADEKGNLEGPTPELADYDPTMDLPSYRLPSLDLLEDYDSGVTTVTNDELMSNKNRIVETLASYKIKIDKIKATIGPTVTLYEIVPAPGIRISKIKNLEDDIALSLSALGIRIIAPIPGKGTIGIEVPNLKPRIVSMKSILSSKKFIESNHELAVALGRNISNETFTFDLTKMPHLLVAGATGQGKSVGLNAIIASLLYKKHPAQLKFVMVDPKKVELSLFSKIERHFLAKLADTEDAIITDTQKVIRTLNSLCAEMDKRYDLLQTAQVRNIKEYNKKFISRKLNPEKGHHYMPFIVVIIDEFADLIMTAGREIETPISRLAQLARAIGIHLIIATQRPTTNIITGVIKANFPARIAFRVSSMIDSRTILDGPGADQLIGRGDMLFLSGSEPVRLQCAFIDTPEIEQITEYIGGQRGYPTAMELEPVDEDAGDPLEIDLKKRDDLFEDAARLVIQHQQGSTSLIQRKLSLGYNRAGRIVDQLEAAGILGPFEGSKARQVLLQDEFSLEQILKELD